MKLILKQYLASLKERSELDAILPDLLSQMGLNVYARPIRGANEYGVDVAAVGRIGNDVEKVYLFSVKSGNLTRSTWHGSTDQALRPSLESIIDSYIPSRLPPEHKNKPIVICMCFGGDIQTTTRQEVTGFTKRNSNSELSFEEWNGDKLSDLIMEYLIKEELLPQDWQSLLRKALALLDEPEASLVHFRRLVQEIVGNIDEKEELVVKAINRINLCLWILFSWCRESDNLESAYISSEYCTLIAWEAVKKYKTKSIYRAYDSLLSTYFVITDQYLDKCLIPFVDKKHGISLAISSPSSIDVNLKLFSFLGMLSIRGQWVLHELSSSYRQYPPIEGDNNVQQELNSRLSTITRSIKLIIVNNPLLLSPYCDSQAIDIMLALHLLSQSSEHDEFVAEWLEELIQRTIFSYNFNTMYPTNFNTFEELLEHKESDNSDVEYKQKVTKGSILYPVLAVFSALYKVESASKKLYEFTEEKLAHCTLQYWYPNKASEEFIYNGGGIHGLASTNFEMDTTKVIHHVVDECKNSTFFWELSAVDKGYSPLVLSACRYYRLPIPLHTLGDLFDYHMDKA